MLSWMQTSGVAVDRLRRTLKSGRRHLKECRRSVFASNSCQVVQAKSEVRENLIIGCLSRKSTHFQCQKGQVITSYVEVFHLSLT